MGILEKILKRNKKDDKQTTDKKEKVNPNAEFRKSWIPEEREFSADELDEVMGKTPREHMIHNLPKGISGKDDGR